MGIQATLMYCLARRISCGVIRRRTPARLAAFRIIRRWWLSSQWYRARGPSAGFRLQCKRAASTKQEGGQPQTRRYLQHPERFLRLTSRPSLYRDTGQRPASISFSSRRSWTFRVPGWYVPFKSCRSIVGQCSRKNSGKSLIVIPSGPGAPPLRRTFFQAFMSVYCCSVARLSSGSKKLDSASESTAGRPVRSERCYRE